MVSHRLAEASINRLRGPTFLKHGPTPCARGHVSERYRSGQCVACAKEKARAWQMTNPEKVRVSERRNDRRPARLAAKAAYKRWRRQTDQAFRDRERERTRRKKLRLWRSDPAFRQRMLDAVHRRRGAKGTHSQEDIARIFKMQGGRCCYCRARLGAYEVDHIVPISRGGTNYPNNLQLTCVGACNQEKGARDPLEYARSLGRLL